MTKSFEERFDELTKNDSNGYSILTLGKQKMIDFLRTEISLAKKEERERIIKILDMSIFNDPDYYHGSEKLSCVRDLIQKITNDH
jgi:hypothetical protein